MKKSILHVAALALPVLFAASCGGSDFFGLDGGSGGDAGSGVCPAGVTVHRIATGTYTAVVGTGVIVSDSCLTGAMGSNVEGSRSVSNDSQGNITLQTADGQTVLGTGPVRCNMGTLTYGPNPPVYTNDGTCNYSTENSVQFTVTSDNSFDIEVTQTRSNSTSVGGNKCMQPNPSCQLVYRVSMKQ
jgi:hypothetical protein